jgi:hypothetical protein
MSRKEDFEKSMSTYFPNLSLKPGRLNDYKDSHVQIAWFFYEEALDHAERKQK